MLSDEEKQVVDYLIFHKYENSSKKEDMIDKVIEIIEKQSKEIEALKLIHESYKEMIEENNYISVDKIKAMLKNEIINIGGFECVAKEDVQSLLEE